MNMTCERGFSLIEIMIAMAIGAILAMALAEMTSNSAKGQAAVRAMGDIQTTSQLLTMVMSNSGACTANLTGISFNTAPLPATIPIPTPITYPNGTVLVQASAPATKIGAMTVQSIGLTNLTPLTATSYTGLVSVVTVPTQASSMLGVASLTASAPVQINVSMTGTTATITNCGAGGFPKILSTVTFTTNSLQKFGSTQHQAQGTVNWPNAPLPDTNYQVYCSLNAASTNPTSEIQTTFSWANPTVNGFDYYVTNVHDYATGNTYTMNCMAIE
jgi:prepilin-type N-terminal cleavage/methylation domain-containing protein